MRHLIKLTAAVSKHPPIFINPHKIVALVPSPEHTMVHCGAEDFWRVVETPEEIDMQIDLLILKQQSGGKPSGRKA